MSCPRVSVVLDHPVTVEFPIGRYFSKVWSAFFSLVMCVGRFLRALVCLHLLAELLFVVCKTNMLFLPGMDSPIYWW